MIIRQLQHPHARAISNRYSTVLTLTRRCGAGHELKVPNPYASLSIGRDQASPCRVFSSMLALTLTTTQDCIFLIRSPEACLAPLDGGNAVEHRLSTMMRDAPDQQHDNPQ